MGVPNCTGTAENGKICARDSFCLSGFCKEGICALPDKWSPCNPNKNLCPRGFKCHIKNAACLPVDYRISEKCVSTADCPWGQYCRNREKCVVKANLDAACSSSTQCDDLYGCDDRGRCATKCLKDGDCLQGKKCEKSKSEWFSICVPAKANPAPDKKSPEIASPSSKSSQGSSLLFTGGIIVFLLFLIIVAIWLFKRLRLEREKIHLNDLTMSEGPSQQVLDTISVATYHHPSNEKKTLPLYHEDMIPPHSELVTQMPKTEGEKDISSSTSPILAKNSSFSVWTPTINNQSDSPPSSVSSGWRRPKKINNSSEPSPNKK